MSISDTVERLKKAKKINCWNEILLLDQDWLDQYLQSQYLNVDNLTFEQKQRYFYAMVRAGNQCSGFYSDSAVECTERCNDVVGCKNAKKEILSKDPFPRVEEILQKPAAPEPANDTKVISMEPSEPLKPTVGKEIPKFTKKAKKDIIKPEVVVDESKFNKQKKYNLIIIEGFAKHKDETISKETLQEEMAQEYTLRFAEKAPKFNYTNIRKPDVISAFCLGLLKKIGIKYSLVGNDKLKIESV